MKQNAATMLPFEARVSKKKLYLMLGLAISGYAVLWFLVDRVERIIFGLCVAIAVCYGIKETLLNDTRIVIDDEGVLDSRLGFGAIRWRDIRGVYVTEFQNIAHVCLEVSNADDYLRKRSMLARGALKFHHVKNNISPFNINVGVLDVSASEIYDAIAKRIDLESKQ